jgi:hypothetical protein
MASNSLAFGQSRSCHGQLASLEKSILEKS